MLKSVGDRTPFLNWRCNDVLLLNVVYAFTAFDVICDVFDNSVWDVCLV